MLTSIRESRTCVYGARKNYFMYDILSYCIAQIVGTGHFLGLWKISEIALSFLWIFYYYFMCIDILPICISLHHMHVWSLQRPKEDIGSPGTRHRASCEFPCSCQLSNSSLLEKQPVLLNTELSLQLHLFLDFGSFFYCSLIDNVL